MKYSRKKTFGGLLREKTKPVYRTTAEKYSGEPDEHKASSQLPRGSSLNTKGPLKITLSLRIVFSTLECSINKWRNIFTELCKDGKNLKKKEMKKL